MRTLLAVDLGGVELYDDGSARFRYSDGSEELWPSDSIATAQLFSMRCAVTHLPDNCPCLACEITMAVRRAKKATTT